MSQEITSLYNNWKSVKSVMKIIIMKLFYYHFVLLLFYSWDIFFFFNKAEHPQFQQIHEWTLEVSIILKKAQ